MKKMLINLSLITVFGLVAPSVIDGSYHVVKNIKSIDKFAFNQVTIPNKTAFADDGSVSQDKAGNIWVSSDTGLYKSADGTTFVQAGIDNKTLPANVPTKFLLQDNAGNIWVLAGSGSTQTLYKSTDGVTFTVSTIAGNNTFQWLQMMKDFQGYLWVVSSSGLFKSTDGTTFTLVTGGGIPANFQPLTIYQSTNNGTIFVADTHNIYSSSNLGLGFKLNTIKDLPLSIAVVTSPKTWPTILQDKNGNTFLMCYWNLFKCTLNANGSEITSLTKISITGALFFYYGMFIDSNGYLYVDTTDGWGTQTGVLFKSFDGGNTFVNLAVGLDLGFFEDNTGNVWVSTVKGTQMFGGALTPFNADFLTGSSVFSVSQDKKGNVWAISTTGVYKCSSLTYKGTGYSTSGTQINQQYNSLNYIFSNRNILFFANDAAVATVTINNVVTTVNGAGFSLLLTQSTNGGNFNVKVNYSDGTESSWNFMVINNNKNMGYFTSNADNKMQNYTAKINDNDVNYYLVRGTTPNFQIQLGMPGYNPIPDFTKSYYEQIDTSTLAPMPNTKTALSATTNITKAGFYFVTITDKLGNTSSFYVQLGGPNDKPFFNPINPLIPLFRPYKQLKPAMKMIKPSQHIQPAAAKIFDWADNLPIIISAIFIGGIISVGLASFLIVSYYKRSAQKTFKK